VLYGLLFDVIIIRTMINSCYLDDIRHDTSVVLSGGPLLLMELAFLLRGVGAEVIWTTYPKPTEGDNIAYSLENKMLDRGVQVRDL